MFSHLPVGVLIQRTPIQKCPVYFQEKLHETRGNFCGLYFARLIADTCYLPGVTLANGYNSVKTLHHLSLMLEEIAE